MASKDVFNCTYRTSKVVEQDGVPVSVERTVFSPGDEVKGLDKDTKEALKEQGLIVSLDDFESTESESGPTQVAASGTQKAAAASSEES